MQSVVYLLKSLCHLMVRRIWLSAAKGLLCAALLSFDILSDIAVPKQLCWMHGSPGMPSPAKRRWRRGIKRGGKTVDELKISDLLHRKQQEGLISSPCKSEPDHSVSWHQMLHHPNTQVINTEMIICGPHFFRGPKENRNIKGSARHFVNPRYVFSLSSTLGCFPLILNKECFWSKNSRLLSDDSEY